MMSLVYIYIKKDTHNYFYNNYDSFITTLFNNKPTHDSAHLWDQHIQIGTESTSNEVTPSISISPLCVYASSSL